MESASRHDTPLDPGLLTIQADGREEVQLRFLEHDHRFYVIPSAESPEWATLAVQRGGCRMIDRSGAGVNCAVRYVVDSVLRQTVLSEFRAKWGPDMWARYFAGSSKLIELDPHRTPVPPSAAELLEIEFDAAAPFYDDALAHHGIERELKRRVAAWLVESLRRTDPLLEIGPGTGFHTLPLLAEGHRVIALDSSTEMLSRLRERAARYARDGHLTTHHGRLGELHEALSEYPDGTFGAAFSVFGAFNIEPEIRDVGRELGRLIRPGGGLFFSSLNRPGLTPFGWEVALGRPRAAAARLGGHVRAGEIRYPLDLHLRTPREWDRLLGPCLRRVGRRAVSALAPPFDSDRIERFFGATGAARMGRWDRRISGWRGSWRLAEWVWLTYERVGADAPAFKL